MTVIPDHVLESYIKHYSPQEMEKLERLYETLINKAMAEHLENVPAYAPAPERTLIMTAGAQGAGKTRMLHEMVETLATKGRRFVLVEFDDIINQIPAVKNDTEEFNSYFSNHAGYVQPHLHNAKERWIPGAKWVADKMLNALTTLGLPIAYETTASGPNIESFLQNFKAAHYQIDLHIVDAPMAVKIESAKRHHLEDKAVEIKAEAIRRSSQGVVKNIGTLADYADNIKIYWRPDTSSAPQLLVSTPVPAKVSAREHIDSFNAEHKEGLTIGQILRTHREAEQCRLNARRIKINGTLTPKNPRNRIS